MGLRWHGTAPTGSIIAVDPPRLARWWAEVLRLHAVEDGPETMALSGLRFVPGDCDGVRRLQLELDSDDLTADVEKLLDMGARHVSPGASEGIVLADPEGNEFHIRSSNTCAR